MTTATVITGQCLCGAVQFEVTPPTKWCAHCHCSMCRRAHGAAFVTWFGVPTDQFRLVVGEDSLTRYASSDEATRSFCCACGSTLFFESSRWAGEIHIALAHISGRLDRQPQAHVFFDDRAHWVDVTDDLPRRGGATGTESLE